MKSLSTQLETRELRYDGVAIVDPSIVVDALLRGVHPSKLRVTQHTPDTLLFNDNADAVLAVKAPEPVALDFSWQLPEPYLSMDLRSTIVDRAVVRLLELNYPPDVNERATHRIMEEYEEIERRGMVEFFRTIIYIIDTFKKEGVVWGVGRGSSCASYILFILGLHSVDAVVYDVPLEEFFHN